MTAILSKKFLPGWLPKETPSSWIPLSEAQGGGGRGGPKEEQPPPANGALVELRGSRRADQQPAAPGMRSEVPGMEVDAL